MRTARVPGNFGHGIKKDSGWVLQFSALLFSQQPYPASWLLVLGVLLGVPSAATGCAPYWPAELTGPTPS